MKLKNNEPRILAACGTRLYPGINVVDDSVGKEIVAHRVVKFWVKEGRLSIIKEAVLKPSDVSEIYNVTQLRELAKGPNKALSAAAKAQMKKIDQAVKPKESIDVSV